MFPSLKLSLHSLQPNLKYSIYLEFVPCSEVRYKYSSEGWTNAGGGEPHSPCRVYCHPDSPALGAHWASQPVSFDRLKLTNSALPQPGQIVLNSMHRYRPRLVVQAEDGWGKTFEFSETEFIAVTAYQVSRLSLCTVADVKYDDVKYVDVKYADVKYADVIYADVKYADVI